MSSNTQILVVREDDMFIVVYEYDDTSFVDRYHTIDDALASVTTKFDVVSCRIMGTQKETDDDE